MENLGYMRLGVSRTSQIHVTSPNLDFPYFNFLGGGTVKKKHPVFLLGPISYHSSPCLLEVCCLSDLQTKDHTHMLFFVYLFIYSFIVFFHCIYLLYLFIVFIYLFIVFFIIITRSADIRHAVFIVSICSVVTHLAPHYIG